jgi:hypothetical protein
MCLDVGIPVGRAFLRHGYRCIGVITMVSIVFVVEEGDRQLRTTCTGLSFD